MDKIIKNIFWLLFDKIFILLLQFVIGVKIANYYGAYSYGTYTYAISIVAFSGIFFELLNARVIKKYYNGIDDKDIVKSTNFFRNTVAIILFLGVLALGKLFNIEKVLYIILVLLTVDNILLTSTFGIENYFEYRLEAKKIVISNNFVKLLSYLLQYICIIYGKSIVYIVVVRCIGSIVRVVILKVQYHLLFKGNNQKSKINMEKLINMFHESKYLWLTFVSFVIYTQMDKLMVGYYLGKKEVGVYTIGEQLANVLLMLVGPLQNSLFPKMLELYRLSYEEYIKFYQKMNIVITQLYILIVISAIIVVKFSFKYVYSEEYSGAIGVFIVLAFSILAKANGALQTSHMTIKEITKKNFYKTLIGLIINIILNIILIKKYGVIGSAIATLITQWLALFVIDFFIKEYREQAIIQLKSFNPYNLYKILRGK